MEVLKFDFEFFVLSKKISMNLLTILTIYELTILKTTFSKRKIKQSDILT